MTNLSTTYHKGRYRGGEWAKHLRPYLKRLGNKRFRKVAESIDQVDINEYARTSKRKVKKRIRVKLTIMFFGDRKYSYYKSYQTLKDVENAVKRPNVVHYTIINYDYNNDDVNP